MGLKNKDGTPYKLSTPNPIMSEMSMWDKKSKLILHNVGGKLVSYEEATVAFHEEEPKIVEQIKAPAPKPTPEPVKVQEEPKIDKFDVIPIIESFETPEDHNALDKVKVWCLPAKNDKEPVQYGQKFIFEAILEDESDFQIMLYTTTDAVTEGSVLFPKTHDKRWWRVAQVTKDNDGLIRIIASITHYHPEFSSQ